MAVYMSYAITKFQIYAHWSLDKNLSIFFFEPKKVKWKTTEKVFVFFHIIFAVERRKLLKNRRKKKSISNVLSLTKKRKLCVLQALN